MMDAARCTGRYAPAAAPKTLCPPLSVPHALAISCAEGAEVSAPVTLDGQAGRTGVLRGLTIAHYYDTALTVTGGHWVLEDCEICRYDPNPAAPDPATLRPWPSPAPRVLCSSRISRASGSIILRHVASLELRRCTIRDCAIGVLLDRQETRLTAVECRFINTKEAVSTRRGGAVHLERCRFERNDVALRLDETVSAQYLQ